ncbi:hypothetical protein ACLOJK_025035 [Asimina triloba]
MLSLKLDDVSAIFKSQDTRGVHCRLSSYRRQHTEVIRLSLQASPDEKEHASTPPRGWNSYDSFCWIVSEEAFLQNAEIISKRLKAHGYEYVVVDYLWYRRNVAGAYVDSLGFDVIDEWGRVIPDPERWPSSRGGKGFKEVAKKVHDMGLKFGIHVMRGISTQAFNANTPILDTTKGGPYVESGKEWRAKDIGLPEKACAWMRNGFMSVDTSLGAGKAFLRSLYQQYAEWDVDFGNSVMAYDSSYLTAIMSMKHDCVFGQDLNLDEISYVSKLLEELDRPVMYSLSPGPGATPAMAAEISHLVNMYRITGDDWDLWRDVKFHFDVARDFGNSALIGAEGLKGKSWPDLDMLPFGWLTDPGSNRGPYRNSKLTFNEQRAQITLWAMAKSPLMFGGDLRHIDDATFNLITNPAILEINAFSTNNREFPYVSTRNPLKCHRVINHSRSLKSVNPVHNHELHLTSCKDYKAKGWVIEPRTEEPDQICWKDSLGSKDQLPFCLNKRQPPISTSDEENAYKQRYEGKFHLSALRPMDFCIDASMNRSRVLYDPHRSWLTPCKWDTSQLWELNHDGTLANSYSGLCASMETVKGEIYVAFFNLNQQETIIWMKMEDLAKAFPTHNLGSCKCTEVWSGEECKSKNKSLFAKVNGHGCALFVLNCS